MELAIYVPIEGTPTSIKPGSAICGLTESEWTELHGRPVPSGGPGAGPVPNSRLVLYYEGNVYSSGSMPDWQTMLFHAADRLIVHYPTVARCSAEPEGWLQVGWYDYERRSIDIDEQGILDSWIVHGKFAPNPQKADLIKMLGEF